MLARVLDTPDKCRCRPRARVFNIVFVRRKYLFYHRHQGVSRSSTIAAVVACMSLQQ